MISKILCSVIIFRLLYKIDCDLAQQTIEQRCPYCNGPLCKGFYCRKPRGFSRIIPDEYCVRMSLCCSREGCRRRVLPPSCLFWDRRVYWRVVILVVMSLHQRRVRGYSAKQLMNLYGVSTRTLERWVEYFRELFPQSSGWKKVQGMVGSEVDNRRLPGSLLEYFLKQRKTCHEEVRQALIQSCRLLAVNG
jgi:hypothetical protein